MKTVSCIITYAASLSLALAPAIAVAGAEPSRPEDRSEPCKCDCQHGKQHGHGDISAAKPASSDDVPEWVRQSWTSP